MMKGAPGIKYLHNPRHRDGSPGKSQWTIDKPEELACFKNALSNKWVLPYTGWGLYYQDGKVTYLGISWDRETELFIAKFVDSHEDSIWHGYPADCFRNQRDIPAMEILKKWLPPAKGLA